MQADSARLLVASIFNTCQLVWCGVRMAEWKKTRTNRSDVYRAGFLDLCRAWQWAENTPFSQGPPYLVASPPNQRPAQRGVALERANRIDDHRDFTQSGLCRSLCLWAA